MYPFSYVKFVGIPCIRVPKKIMFEMSIGKLVNWFGRIRRSCCLGECVCVCVCGK